MRSHLFANSLSFFAVIPLPISHTNMTLSSFRENWKRDRAWGKSVPEVPEDHVEPPPKGAQRFSGNHGVWMLPLGMAALLFCLLATLSTPIYEPMSVLDLSLKGDIPGGSGTPQTLKVGLWGFCLSGSEG